MSCPFDYTTHEKWVKRAIRWQKNNPEKHKQAMKKWGLKHRSEIVKRKLEK